MQIGPQVPQSVQSLEGDPVKPLTQVPQAAEPEFVAVQVASPSVIIAQTAAGSKETKEKKKEKKKRSNKNQKLKVETKSKFGAYAGKIRRRCPKIHLMNRLLLGFRKCQKGKRRLQWHQRKFETKKVPGWFQQRSKPERRGSK